jgi:hypothetical protein
MSVNFFVLKDLSFFIVKVRQSKMDIPNDRVRHHITSYPSKPDFLKVKNSEEDNFFVLVNKHYILKWPFTASGYLLKLARRQMQVINKHCHYTCASVRARAHTHTHTHTHTQKKIMLCVCLCVYMCAYASACHV